MVLTQQNYSAYNKKREIKCLKIKHLDIGKPGPFPAQIEPMLATLVNRPFDDADCDLNLTHDRSP
jgi:hypothetical protein